MGDDVDKLMRPAITAGCILERGTKHRKLRAPTGRAFIVPRYFANDRAKQNFKTMLRRFLRENT